MKHEPHNQPEHLHFFASLVASNFAAPESRSLAPWYRARQERAWEQVQKLGWPRGSDEAWKYLNVSAVAQQGFRLPEAAVPAPHATVLPAEILALLPREGARLVFVDGVFIPELSTLALLAAQCVIKPWQQACNENAAELEPLLNRIDSAVPGDFFTSLNEVLLSGGFFIAVPAGKKVNELVHVLHYSRAARETARGISQQLRFMVHLAPGAELTLSSTFVGEAIIGKAISPPACTNVVWDFICEAGAQGRIFHQQVENSTTFHFAAVRALEEQNSAFKAAQLSLGAALSRVHLWLNQNGKAAHSQVDSLMFARASQQSEVKTTMGHNAAHGSSDQYHKALLADQARGVFHGCIKISSSATKTNANLLNKNLLLSAGCEMDTRPQLEIDTDDVKCSHGATVSQLQAEELFYLQSRGITAAAAQALLSQAYIAEFLQRIEHPAIARLWGDLLGRFLGKEGGKAP